jgi:hypothetical protein
MAGVPAGSPYLSSKANIAIAGQTSTQAPQRRHVSRNRLSSMAPGGRSHLWLRAAPPRRRSRQSANGAATRLTASRKNVRRSELYDVRFANLPPSNGNKREA